MSATLLTFANNVAKLEKLYSTVKSDHVTGEKDAPSLINVYNPSTRSILELNREQSMKAIDLILQYLSTGTYDCDDEFTAMVFDKVTTELADQIKFVANAIEWLEGFAC